jgi:hypothetical protein
MKKKIRRLKELMKLCGFLTPEQKAEFNQLAAEVRAAGIDLSKA